MPRMSGSFAVARALNGYVALLLERLPSPRPEQAT